MSQVKVSIRDNGPLLVSGPIEVLDGEGKTVPIAADKPAVALCRCGASARKPFCDGAHEGTGFEPLEFTVTETKEVALCQCKHTKTPPYCDGSHQKL